MKSRIPVLIVVFVISWLVGGVAALSAQVVSDPNDQLYTDLSLWQERGLIARLPPLRPYPIQLVKRYLTEVEHDGTKADQVRAAGYLSQIDGKANAHLIALGEARTDLSKSFTEVGVQALSQGSFGPHVSYSARLGAKAISGNGDSVLPEYGRSTEDYIYDGSVHSLGSSGLTPRLSMTTQAAFGSPSAYLEAGVMRSSFGPFFGDNVVLSPFAPQAGVVSFTWQQGLFTYTQLLEDLTATTNDGSIASPSYSKYLALHSLEFYPLPWLHFGALESIVWGHRLEPLYLLPIPTISFYTQGLHGYADNSFLGLTAGVKLPHQINANTVLYVDDGGFNQFIKLDFNAMFVAAFQGGVTWTPNLPFLTRLSANYTLVTPYTYTHLDAGGPSGVNYQNYTTQGQSLGPSLEPNSDRIQLTALARPTRFLDLTLFGRFIRHGNPSEGLANMPAGSNGTVFDPGYDSSGAPTFTVGYQLPPGITRYDRFLTQPVLEQTLQAGITASLRFQTPIGELTGNFSYTFEHIANAIDGWGNGYPASGASNGNPVLGNDLTNNYVSVSFDLRYP